MSIPFPLASASTLRRSTAVRLTALSVMALVLVGMATTALADEPLFARLETEAGNIVLVFYPELAPHHVNNFVHLSRTGFFDGTAFHRIVPGFVIQGGDPLSKDLDPRNDGTGGPLLRDVLTDEEWQLVVQVAELLDSKGYAMDLNGRANLKAEFSQATSHVRGTLSMARGPQPDSGGSQFFVCVNQRPDLDRKYSVFGHAFSGMDVADKIVSAETNAAVGRQAPAVPIHITTVTVFSGTAGLSAAEKADWDALPAGLQNVQ